MPIKPLIAPLLPAAVAIARRRCPRPVPHCPFRASARDSRAMYSTRSRLSTHMPQQCRTRSPVLLKVAAPAPRAIRRTRLDRCPMRLPFLEPIVFRFDRCCHRRQRSRRRLRLHRASASASLTSARPLSARQHVDAARLPRSQLERVGEQIHREVVLNELQFTLAPAGRLFNWRLCLLELLYSRYTRRPLFLVVFARHLSSLHSMRGTPAVRLSIAPCCA